MSHLPDQPPDGVPRQLRVGVERDHVADVRRHGGRLRIGVEEGGVGRTAQQPVQFVELAALALPADPPSFAFVPDPPAVKQQKAFAAGSHAVPPVELRDALHCHGEESLVALGVLGLAIDPIGKEREMKFAFRAREVVDLQALDLLPDRLRRGQERRHRDERTQMRGNAVAKFQSWQERRDEAPSYDAVQQRDRRIHGGDGAPNAEQEQPLTAEPRCGQGDQRYSEEDRGDGGDAACVAADAEPAAQVSKPGGQRRPEADRPFECRASPGKEVIPRIALAAFPGSLVRGPLRCQDGAVRDVEFRELGAAGQLLNDGAVEVPRREIHVRKTGAGCKYFIDEADALEQLRPIDVGNQTHACNDVAYGDVRGGVPLMFVAHGRVGRRSLRGQTLVEPCQRGGNPGILV